MYLNAVFFFLLNSPLLMYVLSRFAFIGDVYAVLLGYLTRIQGFVARACYVSF